MVGANFAPDGVFDLALVYGDRTARVEAAAGRRVNRAWHVAFEPLSFHTHIGVGMGDSRKQCLRIGVGRLRVEVPRRSKLNHFTEVHNPNSVADVLDDT